MAKVLPFPQLTLEFPTVAPVQLPPDADARAEALDVRRSFLVEAPAGSGKTGLLIQRFLKLLADDSVTAPEQVLAITFTRKATAELRDRVLSHLEAARRNPGAFESAANPASFAAQTGALAADVLERDRQLGWSLLDHPNRLNIRTIDAVGAEIARTLPVLSGSGGRLDPAEDAWPLYREAARRTLLLLGSGDGVLHDSLRDLLLHRDNNLADCESLIAGMLSRRDQWGDIIPLRQEELTDAQLDANILPRLQRTLDHSICSALAAVVHVFPADALADLTELAAELGKLDGYRGEPSPLEICVSRTDPPEAEAAHLKHWRALAHLLVTPSTSKWRTGFKINHIGCMLDDGHKAQLRALLARVNHSDELLAQLNTIRGLPCAVYPAEQWAVAKSLFRVVSRALAELQLVFAQRNQCDFTELNLLARQALGNEHGAEDLASALGAHLQHLLVDEMQDTSTIQYELLELLTHSWDGYSQTVFLVGDPRQSIYLFRHARVERFVRAMNSGLFGDLPLTHLRLTANFRSQRNLVDQFNADFGLIFTRQDSIPHTPADATLPASSIARGISWHANVLPFGANANLRDPPKFAREQYARQILGIARQWLAKPLPADRMTIRDESGNEILEPWRIAVLVGARPHLAEIVSAIHGFNLEHSPAEQIPFRAVEIDPLNQRQEILDLTALTRALLHPGDRAAGLAVLRAPWCGLPLADLHTLTGSDDPACKGHSLLRLIEERGHLLPDDSCERMTRVWNVLRAASAQRARLTAAQLVERAWHSLAGASWLNPTQLANTRRFFQLLDTLDAESDALQLDPAILTQRLNRLFAEPDPAPAATAYVELLTIHKAKGLEWDVVLVPGLERVPNNDPAQLLTWLEINASNSPADRGNDSAGVLFAPIAAKGAKIDTLPQWIQRIRRAREAAERKRLFYVACTRARQELHLFAVPAFDKDDAIKPRAYSLLDAAWPAAAAHITASAAPFAAPAAAEPEHFALAAGSETAPRFVERLPLWLDPAASFAQARALRLQYTSVDATSLPGAARFSRPEGSFAARSLGNAVHVCMEMLAGRFRDGATADALLAELPSWAQRIAAILRAYGLPRAAVEQLTRDARSVLEKTLRDPNGLWLLAANLGASNEFALNSSDDAAGPITSVRIDRVFHAGPEPHAPGEEYLWIVDYKTSSHGAGRLDDFLDAQRTAYGPQLEVYARTLGAVRSKSPGQIRLALYFPAIPRLTWWKYNEPG